MSHSHAPTTSAPTLPLHDALPIYVAENAPARAVSRGGRPGRGPISSECRRQRALLQNVGPSAVAALDLAATAHVQRSEEHTSELQSRGRLVCPPPLEKTKWSLPWK